MRHWHTSITVTIALTLALTVNADPVAWADPPPLARAEAAIAAENCGLPLAAWADPPPLAQAEAAIAAYDCGRAKHTLDPDLRPSTHTRPPFAHHPRHDRAGRRIPRGLVGATAHRRRSRHHVLDPPHRSDRHLAS